MNEQAAPHDLIVRSWSAPVLADSTRLALGFSLLAALTAGCVAAVAHRGIAEPWSDFSQLSLGARALALEMNPYTTVITPAGMPLVYPLPAVLLALPLAWLPTVWADSLWAAFGVGVLAYAHARSGRIERPAVLAFCSAAIAQCVLTGQWSALLLGAMLLSADTAWGGLLTCTPTTAIWLFITRPSWRAMHWIGTALALSVMVRPMWPLEWWAATRVVMSYAVVPAVLPFGFIVVLVCASRWRRPEARLLLLMMMVPHTTFIYETLPLLYLVPTTWRQGWLLCASSWVRFAAICLFVPHSTPIAEAVHLGGLLSMAGIYLPCALLILRRPNRACCK